MTTNNNVSRLEAVARADVLDFLGHAFRNIDLPPLSADDLNDIAGGLARFSRAALKSPPVVSEGWQPIETAPKDGTDVLVYKDVATVPVVHIAWYRGEPEWVESGQYCGFCDSLEKWEGWWSYTRNSVTQEKLEGYAEPTHWQPLPEPPLSMSVKSEADQGGQ